MPAASISVQQNSSDLTQSTLISELPAGPELTLHSTAVVDNNQFLPKPPPSYSSLFSALHPVLFEHPQFSLPIIKHIPKSVRPSCNVYLSSLLSTLCAILDNISLWRTFLNFAPSFLFKPRRAGKRQNLSSIIKKRLGDAQVPQPSANAKVNYYVYQNNVAKARSLASPIVSKMEDGDVSDAIRLLHSENKPVYDSDDIYQSLIDHHSQILSSRIPFNDPRDTNALQILEKDILLAFRNFPAGSSDGPDSLRPKHLLDFCNCKATDNHF